MTAETSLHVEAASRRVPWPERTDVAILCFLALLIAYCDRVNLALAIPELMQQHQWDTAKMGWILSAFFAGYVLCMIPAGLVVQRIGPYRVIVAAVGLWSVITGLTPIPDTITGLYLVRFLLGTCESALFPCINALLADCFPRNEYARAAGFCWSGGYAGPVLAVPAGAILLQVWQWPAIFYAFACVGLLWVVGWLTFGPKARPPASLPESISLWPASPRGYWKGLLLQPAVWALLILHFASNWFAYVLLTWLPTYLQVARHFTIASMAVGAALPFAAALCGTNLFALLIDRLSCHYARTTVRKAFVCIFVAGAFLLFLLSHVTSALAIVAVLCASTALMTAATPVYASGSMDIAPQRAAALVGIQAAFANLAGFAAPVVSGYAAHLYSWNLVFVITAAVCIGSSLVYLGFGSADRLGPMELPV